MDFKLTLTNNSTLYSQTEIKINPEPNSYGSGCGSCRFPRPGGPLFLTADNSYNGQFGQGWITIDYANADLKLHKPLIVAEGFDPGYLLIPESQFGYSDFNSFLDQQNGSTTLQNILQGTNQQYDIIYVDWYKGADYLQRNGYLLERVIRWVNEQKAIDGSNELNVVLGQSMGGVIARWALRDMETHSLNHQTRLFISWDAPQQGANVPLAYQHAARHANNLLVQTAIPLLFGGTNLIRIVRNGLNLMDQPAAKQMLYNRALSNGQLDNTDHSAWQLELRNMGYPQQSRNVAVSNGSECGIGQGFQPGQTLLSFVGRGNTRILTDLIGSITGPGLGFWGGLSLLTIKPQFLLGIVPGRNDLSFDLQCKAQPEGAAQQIYKGKITYSKKILWLINVNTTITDRTRNSDPSVLPIDNTPGGMYDTRLNVQSSAFHNWAIKYNVTALNIPHFNFVPTVSSLDIGSGNTTLTINDYRAGYVGANPPAPPLNSPFANFTTAFNQVIVSDGTINNNENHIQISPRNGNWVTNELNVTPITTNCSFICSNGNITVTGPDPLCNTPLVYTLNNPPAGTTRTWSATPTGIVSIAPSPDGTTATVSRISSGYFTLQVTITAPFCGSLIVNSASIRAGGFSSSDYPVSGPSSSCKNSYVTYTCPTLPGATAYTWFYPGGGTWTYVSGQNTPSLTLITGLSTGNYQVGVRVANACDDGGSYAIKNTFVNNCGGFFFATSPNPSKGNMTVSSQSQTSSGTFDKIYQIKITDQTGIVKKQFNYSSGVTTTTIDLSGLASGIYILQAYNGSTWASQQILKQ